ncbi:MAG: cysteine-rich CWC family protein [Cyclobacteriaceae bacterium]
MAKHEEKKCPRCDRSFECKVGSILLCQCSTVIFTEAERAYISQQFDDCLCAHCLKDLQKMFYQHQFEKKLKRLGDRFN